MELKDVNLEELEKRYKRERNGKIKERLHYLLLLKEGYKDRDIEKICHTSKSSVSFWHCRFKEEGFEGFRDKKGRGKKAKLSEENLKELDSILDKPYTMENGYTRGCQTKDVQILIKSKFGVSYGSRHIRRIISNLGFVRLVPRPRHKRRNQKDVDEFKEQFKKNAKVWVKT